MEIKTLDHLKQRSKFLTDQEIASALDSLIDSSHAKLCYVCTLASTPRLQRDYAGFEAACIDEIAVLRPMVSYEKYEIFETRIELGNHVFALRHSGEIIGYRWLSRDFKIYPKDLFMGRLPANTAYAYDAFVQPQYRGQGLLAFLTSCMYESAGRGVGLSSYSEFGKLAALKAKEKFGEVKKSLVLVKTDSAEVLKIYD
jgi:GNAT superfamily N-acetyltransferase